MKYWFCPNCKDRKVSEDIILHKMCRCGEWYEEVKNKEEIKRHGFTGC